LSSINSSPVSKPFVITAVVFLFVGSSIGAIWNMALYGISLPNHVSDAIPLHKIIQLDGFLSLLIMGVSYMIVPRFRNTTLQYPKLAYISYVLVISSISISLVEAIIESNLQFHSNILRISGILIFAFLIFNSLRTKPKLVPNADYFIMFAITIFLAVNFLKIAFVQFPQSSLAEIYLWLLFPLMMIFGIMHKTLPSFLGFIRPRKNAERLAIVSGGATCLIGIASIIIPGLEIIFNVFLSISAVSLSHALYIFGGFDKSEIKKLFSGEKKIRYKYIENITKIAFVFLFFGLIVSILNKADNTVFAFYDLSIHYVTIGFIGFSIFIYLPIMLPPIINKTIQFRKFNKLPIYFVISALIMRTIGDFVVLELEFGLNEWVFQYLFGLSGWLVVLALFVFAVMLHRSMDSFKSELKIM